METVIDLVLKSSQTATMIIKSTIPVYSYTRKVREKFDTDRILFSPEFLRESKAIYDNLYPRIIVVVNFGVRAPLARSFSTTITE